MDKRLQNNKKYAAIIIGAILAVLITFSPGSFFILILTAGTVFFIHRFSNKSERNFILIIFLAGLGARVVFTLFVLSWAIFSGHMQNYGDMGGPNYFAPYIFDDSVYYTLRGLCTSWYWLGKPLSQYIIEGIVKHTYGFNGYIPVLAAFFTIFGYSPISSRFINCFLGSLTIILVYSIVKNIFNEKPARLAAVLTAFFPSLFLWSITNLKETSMTFMACLMFWSLVKFQREKRIHYLIIASFSIWAQFSIRHTFKTELSLVAFGLVGVYIFHLFISNLLLSRRIITFFIIFMIAASFAFLEKDKVNSIVKVATHKMLTAQKGAIDTGGICYQIVSDEIILYSKNLGLRDFIMMLGKGWFHIMFEPLPGRIKQSKSMLFSFPQILLWYSLIPFAILGMAISIRYRLRESIFLIMYFLIITSAFALSGGNVGTVFRLRDVNTPVVLIFSAIGLFHTFKSLDVKLNIKNGVDRISPC